MSIPQDCLQDKINRVSSAIMSCWCESTSKHADWTDQKPAYGQDDVTALLIQKELGGKIVRVEWSDQSVQRPHYFNVLDGGKSIDLTRQPFSDRGIFTQPLDDISVIQEDVSEVLHEDADVMRRYQALETLYQREKCSQVSGRVAGFA